MPTQHQTRAASAAEYPGSQLADSHALASRVTGWRLATQARLGMPAGARPFLSIYAKLHVRDRSSAVRRARELRLLAAGRAPLAR